MDLINTQWNPTRKQYIAFKKREVELCAAAQRANPRLRFINTIYSKSTWLLACSQNLK